MYGVSMFPNKAVGLSILLMSFSTHAYGTKSLLFYRIGSGKTKKLTPITDS